ncbi:MAG TPA: ATPase domain-containing protein [Candidatus Dormibacteraeota bacterium]|nr:ATPase domain-containing protein [Candidatus Dormibacteraeota bacterium]
MDRTDRISTGSRRLDEVLDGGLLPNAINLITGVPGSGKTILSQQIAFHNATKERPAMYLSTLSEPMDKLLRYGQSLSFFDRSAIQDGRLIYEDVGKKLGAGGLTDVPAEIDRLLKDRQPALLVIDSFRGFKAMSHDLAAYRQFLYDIVGRLTASAVTAVWNAPYSRAQVLEEAEAAVADSIISFDLKHVAERELRVVQVLKMRGSGYRSGEHVYRLSQDGVEVFPRLADPKSATPYVMSESHTPTGIAALDQLLEDGGYWAGASTVVAGPSGIGKTLMGLHFVFRGAELGEPGVLATFQETEAQLGRLVRSFGWSLDNPDVHVMSRGVVDLNIDEWVYDLMETTEKVKAKRIVVDSLLDVMIAAGDEIRFREWMFSLTQRFTRSGISLMLIVEVAELFQLDRVAEYGITHLADNVILLQYVQDGPELLRALTVLKTRAMRHQRTVRRYEITKDGFELGSAVTPAR